MANLSIPEITRDSKEYRSELLVNKVFKKDGQENNFMTDLGLFHAEKLFIENKEYKYSKDLYKIILALKGQRGAKLDLHGKLTGKSVPQKISITQVEKSEEFGGQPTGGKKENRGNAFERDLYNRLQECITGKTCKGTYARQAKKIIELTSKEQGSPVVHVEHAGGANTSRPLILEGGNPIISPNNPVAHGEKLTDITLTHKNGKMSYLSLKFSSTLTFMNAGVSKTFFLESEMKTGLVKNDLGKAVLKAFGISNAKFCKVFNEYGKKRKPVDPHIENVTSKVDKRMLKALLRTAIGANYWMVHGMEGDRVYFWPVMKANNDAYATVGGQFTLYYGGKAGNGKRIDLEFSNNYYDFKLNIRNKQSGLYPSHIMLDYKSKPATGKQLL